MTDGQWALPALLLPATGSTDGRGGRPEQWDRALVLVLDAIFYLARIRNARALPADFPRHQTVYALPRRWIRARGRGAGSTQRNIWDLAVAIVKRPDQAKGHVLLHRRWVVECSFAWPARFRRLVRGYETSPPPTKP
ncbi:transposase [Streptomyces sp. NPDC017993]|uniref:transposase n=1 Tax=Streptomyces sp. NPDC017993 TaxID=3365027 RepID=UPI00378C4DDF